MPGLPLDDFLRDHLDFPDFLPAAKDNYTPPKEGFKKISIIGEPVIAAFIGGIIERSFPNTRCNTVCPMESDGLFLRSEDVRSISELKIRSSIRDSDMVVADPLYSPIIRDNVPLIPLPSLGISGRMYEADFIDYFDREDFSKKILYPVKEAL